MGIDRRMHMKKTAIIAALVAGVALLIVYATSSSNKVVSDGPDVKAVMALWDEYAQSVSACDLEKWIALWDEEGVQFPPDEPLHNGKKAIMDSTSESFLCYTKSMHIKPMEIMILGDYAYSNGLFTLDLALPETTNWVAIDGKFLSILHKSKDGTWKLWRDSYNNNTPPQPYKSGKLISGKPVRNGSMHIQ
jgi:ketosteroid isomerase-like protein